MSIRGEQWLTIPYFRRGRAFGWFLGCQSLAQIPAASHSPIPMAKNLKVLPRKVKEFDQQVVPDGAVDLFFAK